MNATVADQGHTPVPPILSEYKPTNSRWSFVCHFFKNYAIWKLFWITISALAGIEILIGTIVNPAIGGIIVALIFGSIEYKKLSIIDDKYQISKSTLVFAILGICFIVISIGAILTYLFTKFI